MESFSLRVRTGRSRTPATLSGPHVTMRDLLPVERRATFQGILTKRRMPPHVVNALRPPPKPAAVAQARQHEPNWDERLKLIQHQAHKRLQAARAAVRDELDDLVAQQEERKRRVPAIANRLYSNEQPAHRQPAPHMLHPLQAFAQWNVQPAPADAPRAIMRAAHYDPAAVAFGQRFGRIPPSVPSKVDEKAAGPATKHVVVAANQVAATKYDASRW